LLQPTQSVASREIQNTVPARPFPVYAPCLC